MNNKTQLDYPILTIAIPTYNRPKQIQRQVQLLLPQLTKQVRLVVYDNCSEPCVESYFTDEDLKKFVVIRNVINIGGDANRARCIEMCTTTWVWTLSDDDFITSDALETVLNHIKKNPDAVLINLNHSKDSVHIGFEDFLKDLNTMDSYGDSFWISKCIYNVDKLKPYLFYCYKYVSSMIGQLVFVLKYLENNPNGKVVRYKDLIISCSSVDCSWSFEEYIKSSSFVFESFDRDKYKILDKTLFRTMTNNYLSMINIICSPEIYNKKNTFHLLKIVEFRFGFWNLILNFPIKYLKIMIKLTIPRSILYVFVSLFFRDKYHLWKSTVVR